MDDEGMSLDSPQPTFDSAEGLRIAIVAARYNESHVDALLRNAMETLRSAGVGAEDIDILRVPGSNELPYAVGMVAMGQQVDCVIALGMIIAGDTKHDEIIGFSTAEALHRVGRETEIPVINGIITVENEEQAVARSGDTINRGREFAQAAIEMAHLGIALRENLDRIDEERALREGGEEWQGFFPNDGRGPSKS